MRVTFGLAGVVAGVLVTGLALPLSAHHSFSAEYDAKKPVTVKGTVTKVEWTNPHARIYVDATDENGAVTNWNFELATPNALRRSGWTRNSLKVGEAVTIEGFAGRADERRAAAGSVTLADGRSLFAGNAN
jgi:DNA/RNA endonuclease YhcR with UshA esterase domain